MLSFDEAATIKHLESIQDCKRVAFAAAAATRHLRTYDAFSGILTSGAQQKVVEVIKKLWLALEQNACDRNYWESALEEIMSFLPDQDAEWTVGSAFVEDGLSSVAYTIRCLLNHKSEEAAWAARRSYEAADQAAIRILRVQPGSPNVESEIRSHEIVQRELSRQKRDLTLLKDDSSDTSMAILKRLAFEENLLTILEIEQIEAIGRNRP